MKKHASEKELENSLVSMINAGRENIALLKKIAFSFSSSSARNLLDLMDDSDYLILQDDSNWNQHKDTLIDVSGGMTPDIVLQSSLSRQNRIIIEVKSDAHFGYTRQASQITRYFIHLLSTTTEKCSHGNKIKRAVILATPTAWHRNHKNHEDWQYFLEKYTDLASSFGITLAAIDLDNILA